MLRILRKTVVGQGGRIHRIASMASLLLLLILDSATTSAFVVGSGIRPHTAVKSTFWSRVSATSSSRQADKGALNDQPAQLSLISFDLDDTLFPCGPVVQTANEAQMEYMNAYLQGHGGDDNAVLTLPDFLDTTRSIRRSLNGDPITYSELRRRAIRQQLEQSSLAIPDAVVDKAFDVWLQQRQSSANDHLFSSAVPVLKTLRSTYPDTHFLAITNGRGDPHEMPNIAPYFDLPTLSGEDESPPLRKPNPDIYRKAIQLVDDKKFNAGLWIHVGDCLVNDVAASADCGALAIWFDESSSSSNANSEALPTYSTATVEEVAERKEKARGALLRSTAVIESLEELPNAVATILRSTMQQQAAA